MSDDLLSCPFCGDEHFGRMEMTFFHESGFTKGERIKCNTCGAQAPSTVWNTRAQLSAQAPSDSVPVLWQYLPPHANAKWLECSKETYDRIKADETAMVRELGII